MGTALRVRGHELVTVGRSSGDVRADVTHPGDLARAFEDAGALDAVVSAAGSVPYKRITDMTPDDYLSAYHGKVAAQVELVRQGTTRIAPRGSFTLITGVLSREPSSPALRPWRTARSMRLSSPPPWRSRRSGSMP